MIARPYPAYQVLTLARDILVPLRKRRVSRRERRRGRRELLANHRHCLFERAALGFGGGKFRRGRRRLPADLSLRLVRLAAICRSNSFSPVMASSGFIGIVEYM